jgi:hypothetical protein
MAITLTDVVAVGGLVSGIVGFVLGVMNFSRDRAKLDVLLQWDIEVTPGSEYDPNKKWGLVRVSNVGRRTAFISHVAIKLPKGYDHTHLVAMDSVAGQKLAEGDAPKIFMMSQDNMSTYSKDWKTIVAQVSDSTGKVWLSKPIKERPSWAEGK